MFYMMIECIKGNIIIYKEYLVREFKWFQGLGQFVNVR